LISRGNTRKQTEGLAWIQLCISGASPVIVLLLSSLLSSDAKAVLVFWRLRDALPGHRAFSVHAMHDPRIGLEALRKHVGAFPEAPRDQNATWYRLFKKVDSEASVAQAHRHYLLFRDLTTLSLLLAPLAALTLYFLGVTPAAIAFAGMLLGGQYAAMAIAARNCGVRLVTNVLALHSAKGRT
jgi:hypothetical protein